MNVVSPLESIALFRLPRFHPQQPKMSPPRGSLASLASSGARLDVSEDSSMTQRRRFASGIDCSLQNSVIPSASAINGPSERRFGILGELRSEGSTQAKTARCLSNVISPHKSIALFRIPSSHRHVMMMMRTCARVWHGRVTKRHR